VIPICTAPEGDDAAPQQRDAIGIVRLFLRAAFDGFWA